MAQIWDLREGRLVYTLKGHSGPVTACAFSADGTHFASGGEDGLVMSWRSHLENRMAGGATGASSTTLGAAPFDDGGEMMMSAAGGDYGGATAAMGKGGGRRGGGAVPGRQQQQHQRRRTALGVRTTNAR